MAIFSRISQPFELKPGTYSASGEGKPKIVICCPACGGEFKLPKHYAVGQCGILNPILRCPLYGCRWQAQSRLEGYAP